MGTYLEDYLSNERLKLIRRGYPQLNDLSNEQLVSAIRLLEEVDWFNGVSTSDNPVFSILGREHKTWNQLEHDKAVEVYNAEYEKAVNELNKLAVNTFKLGTLDGVDEGLNIQKFEKVDLPKGGVSNDLEHALDNVDDLVGGEEAEDSEDEDDFGLSDDEDEDDFDLSDEDGEDDFGLSDEDDFEEDETSYEDDFEEVDDDFGLSDEYDFEDEEPTYEDEDDFGLTDEGDFEDNEEDVFEEDDDEDDFGLSYEYDFEDDEEAYEEDEDDFGLTDEEDDDSVYDDDDFEDDDDDFGLSDEPDFEEDEDAYEDNFDYDEDDFDYDEDEDVDFGLSDEPKPTFKPTKPKLGVSTSSGKPQAPASNNQVPTPSKPKQQKPQAFDDKLFNGLNKLVDKGYSKIFNRE